MMSKNKKILYQLRRVLRISYFLTWKQIVSEAKNDELNCKKAARFLRRLYLRKSFLVLTNFMKWHRKNLKKTDHAKKFYYFNLVLKVMEGLRLASRSGIIHKNHDLMYRRFRHNHLAGKFFFHWKKYKLKKDLLKRQAQEYSLKQNLRQKQRYFTSWKFAYNSSIKVYPI